MFLGTILYRPGINTRRNLCIFLWLGLFLLMACRAESVGTDLIRYIEQYSYIHNIKAFQTRTEPGFVIFEKILSFFGVGNHGYIVTVSFIISASFGWFFYKYANKYAKAMALSFFLHFTIGLFVFTLTGIRQSLAISISLFALHFALQRKLIVYLLLVLLAISFHRSALVFAPVYILVNIKIRSYKTIAMLIAAIIVLIFVRQQVFSILGSLSIDSYSDKYQGYLEGDNKSKLSILLVIFKILLPFSVILFWRFQKRKIREVTRAEKAFLILALVGAGFTVLSLNLSIINRFSYYFFSYAILLFVNALKDFKSKEVKDILTFIIIIACVLFFTISVSGGISKIDNYKLYGF